MEEGKTLKLCVLRNREMFNSMYLAGVNLILRFSIFLVRKTFQPINLMILSVDPSCKRAAKRSQECATNYL